MEDYEKPPESQLSYNGTKLLKLDFFFLKIFELLSILMQSQRAMWSNDWQKQSEKGAKGRPVWQGSDNVFKVK